MTTTVIIGGKRHRIDLTSPLGQGGEAYVVDVGGGTVLKLYRPPSDPQYQGDPPAQASARKRLDAIRDKLAAFPRGLPAKVIAPIELATDTAGSVVGYTMPMVTGTEVMAKLGQPKHRQTMSGESVLAVLRDLHRTVGQVHVAKVVIGDFNSLNVLVRGSDAYLIDADSAQFGRWLCATYTTTYVDPLHCTADPASGAPVMASPHSTDTDWYAFAVMALEALTCVGPYGGTYVAPSGPKITHIARPMHRATVWSPGARYPRPAEPWRELLPDEFMAHMLAVFQRDQRGAFPGALLDRMRWTTCTQCGTEHARPQCPRQGCATMAPAVQPITTTTQVRGSVTATTVYRGGGTVVRAETHGGRLVYLVHEAQGYRREDGSIVVGGPENRAMRFRLGTSATYAAMGSTMLRMDRGVAAPTRRTTVQTTDGIPVFAANVGHVYWCDCGGIYRDDGSSPLLAESETRIGDVIAGQTRFWVGERFGFGFGRAGGITVAFVFDAEHVGINDQVKLRITGTLLDATCTIHGDRAWFLSQTKEGARTVNRCMVVRRDGTIEATAETDAGDGSWLGSIRGGVATGSLFLSPTDLGIVRVEVQGTTVAATRHFPDTEPFVDVGCQLLAGADGLYCVSANRREITRLAIR